MPVTINVNNLSLSHKASNTISTATIPDVCKTPSPGGPVPIPYPNIAMSMDLMKGTTTVKADGGMMCANYGSEFFKSTGDEPGVAGGVISSTFIKEATWMTYSFDVKLQGKGACRLTDKMFHNHQNTVNMSGALHPPVFTLPPNDECKELYEAIYRLVWGQRAAPQDGTKGLAWRWKDHALNEGGWGADGKKATNHLDEYKKQREALREKMKQWKNKKKRNCSDDDLPPGAEEYASEQLPELGQKEQLVPTPLTSPFREHLTNLGIAFGKAAATTVGIGVMIWGISRIIRMLPPLWPLQLSPI